MTQAIEVIVVDDEPGLRLMMEDYLGTQNYAVRTADGGAMLDRLLRERPADIIVLDVNMPGEDGISIAARLRQAAERAGIIMLTAAGDEASRVAALSRGADDYIVKPFSLSELNARVRSVLRRLPKAAVPARTPAEFVPMGRCQLDLAGRRLIDAEGHEIGISLAEFELLGVFARHPGQIMSRERLCELAHGRPLEAGDRSVDIRITRLRKKLEQNPALPTAICTARGEGYFFDKRG
jgi:DNA-binding response OmpR family regulator